ncbi:MAG: ADP-ribose pyrophosphatase [Planctomycetota bacterium]
MSEAPDDPPPFAPFGVHRREHVYQSPWCALRRDEVVLPTGKLQEYHVFEIGPAVAVVPVLPDGRVVMIGQYRYPTGNTQWELPAGRLDADETPQAAAVRELYEETGYAAGHLEALPGFYPTGGISAHYAHAFIAHDCSEAGAGALEDSEQIIVRVFTRGEVEALVDAGRLQDAFAALPLLYWLRRSQR